MLGERDVSFKVLQGAACVDDVGEQCRTEI